MFVLLVVCSSALLLENAMADTENENKEKNGNKGITILLAEDDEFIRDIYNRIFTINGYDVIIAENGMIAMEKLEKITPDLILLDIMMPYLNGKDVFKKIKANDKWKDIPIVFLTNVSAQDDLERELLEKADKYLIKAHFTPKEVMEEVVSLVKK